MHQKFCFVTCKIIINIFEWKSYTENTQKQCSMPSVCYSHTSLKKVFMLKHSDLRLFQRETNFQ